MFYTWPVSIAITGEQLAIQESVRDVAARAGTRATVRAMETEPDAWARHWDSFADLGLFTITSDGGTLVDQVAALEVAAEQLVPGPVLPTVLGNLVVGEPMAIAFGGDLRLTGDRITGVAAPVLGGPPDARILLRAGDVWCVAPPQVGTSLAPLDFSRSLARVIFADVRVTVLDDANVDDLAATLFAAEAAGVARWCLDTAVAYAKVREQFDRPIGTFQAVAQRLADGYIDTRFLALTVWQAAWRLAEGLPATEAIATAKLWASDAGHHVAHTTVHIHGGVGIDLDGEAHRYFTAGTRYDFEYGGATEQALRLGKLLAAEPA